MVGRSRSRYIGLGFGVDWDSFIGDLSDISVVVVRGVLYMLGATIGKSNGVRSSDISNSILVGVGFVLCLGLNISSRLVVSRSRGRSISWGRGWSISWGRGGSISWSRGVVDNRGMSNMVGNWVVGGMSNWVMDSMSNWVSNKPMVGNWVSNKSMVGNRD